MALFAPIWRAYRDPRGAMARAVADGRGETPALVELMAACALGLVASLPAAAKTAAGLDVPDAWPGVVSAHVFGYLFLAPLLLYGVAALLHLVARPFGARGGFAGARRATFRAALLAGPLALVVVGLRAGAEAAGAAGVLPAVDALGWAFLLFWLWLLAASFAAAEGFGRAPRVAG